MMTVSKSRFSDIAGFASSQFSIDIDSGEIPETQMRHTGIICFSKADDMRKMLDQLQVRQQGVSMGFEATDIADRNRRRSSVGGDGGEGGGGNRLPVG